LIALLASPALAADPDLAALHALMSCLEAPAPTPVLLSLIGQGALTARSGPGFDEDYCWSLATLDDWAGVTFSSVCVVTGNAAEQAGHPDLYWSDALAPWTEVWLLTSRTAKELDAWAAAALPADSRYEIDGLEEGSALSCSEWHFPLD
jgi:hypothetical protein